MSETSPPSPPALYLVPPGLAPERLAEVRALAAAGGPGAEVLALDAATAPEALEKLFRAGPIAFWGELGPVHGTAPA